MRSLSLNHEIKKMTSKQKMEWVVSLIDSQVRQMEEKLVDLKTNLNLIHQYLGEDG